MIGDALWTLLGPSRKPTCKTPAAGPLRIAMMIETVLLGGAEVVVFQLAEELRRRGHTVFPVGPEGREGWLRTSSLDAGFPWHTYTLHRSIDWSCAEGLAQLLTGLQADVAHSHEFTASVYGTAATRLVGIPHVITMHGNQQTTRKLQRRIALRWAFRRSQATVAVSHDTRRHLEASLGLRPGAVGVVHNGIPKRPGRGDGVRRELGLRDGEWLALAVGSLIARKGHRVLLEALLQLEREGRAPGWKVAIAGEGVERPNLEAFIAEHGIGDRAFLVGNRADVPDLQAAADVFVMPSLWEGLPLAVLEAMFAANPIIATTASGIPEALTHRDHALLVPPGDPAALADALHDLVTHPEDARAMGRRAREHAERQFSIGAMTDAYERRYRGDRDAR